MPHLDPQTILDQERDIKFPYFSAVQAFEIGSAIRERFLAAQAQGQFPNAGCVITCSTFHGHQLFTCIAGDETSVGPNNWKWVEGKKDLVRLNHRSSYYQGRKAIAEGKEREPYAHGGGVPVFLKGSPSAPIAIFVVSGLKEEDDHQLIIDTLLDYIPKMKPLEN